MPSFLNFFKFSQGWEAVVNDFYAHYLSNIKKAIKSVWVKWEKDLSKYRTTILLNRLFEDTLDSNEKGCVK